MNHTKTADSATTAATATSLASNGSNCSAGYHPLGGAAESCTVLPVGAADIYWSGAANGLNATTGRASLALGSLAT